MSYAELTEHEKEVAKKYVTYRTAHERIHEELRFFKADDCRSRLANLWCGMLENALPQVVTELAAIEYRFIRLRTTDDPLVFDVTIGNRHGEISLDSMETRKAVEDIVRRWGAR